MIGVHVKRIICWILVGEIASVIEEDLDTNNCSCEKCLVSKLALECEDEILNRTETLLNDKKVTYAKSNCLIRTISLVIICLCLLVVICVSCYFYQRKYRSKKPFHDINIKLGKIRF